MIYGLWLTFPGHSCCLAVSFRCLFLTMRLVDLRSVTVTFPVHSCCLAVSVRCLYLMMLCVDLWSVTVTFPCTPVAWLLVFCVSSSRCPGLIYGLWLTFPCYYCCLAVSVRCLYPMMLWVDLWSVTVTFPCHFCCLAVSVLCLFLTMHWADLWSVTNISVSLLLLGCYSSVSLPMLWVDLWSVTDISWSFLLLGC